MGLFDRFKKKAPTAEERRQELLRTGRITDGLIIDTSTDAEGNEIAHYVYTLNGVDFESSEILTERQLHDGAKYVAGAHIGVRYDQKNQGNSTIE